MASWSATLLTRLHRYKNLIKRRWWILALTVGLGLVVQGFRVLTAPPVYVSTSRMMVDPQIRIPEKTVYSEELSNFYGTQIELMRSGKVQQRARERLKALHPDIPHTPVSIYVSQQPLSSIFNFSATGKDPETTRFYLDAVMDSFVHFKEEMRSEASQKALSAITQQVLKLERELKVAQQKLFEFQKTNDVLGLEEKGNSAAAFVSQLETELANAQKELQLLELMNLDQTLERQTSPVQPDVSAEGEPMEPEMPTGPELLQQNQESEYLRAKRGIRLLENELERLQKKLTPQHPKIIRIQEDIKEQTELLDFYRSQSVEQLQSVKDRLQLEIKNMESQVETWQAKALETSRLIAEYSRLKADVERVKTLYERLLSTTQNVDVSTSVTTTTISILEPASPPVSKKQGVFKALGMGIVFGLLGGCGILFLLDRIDDRVNSFTELRDFFEEEVLGQVPLESLDGAERVDLLEENDPRQVYSESFRNIRSSLMYMAVEGERPRTLLITSAIPSEGKSTVAANLAITMAFAGSKTLLIDADLRKGVLNQDLRTASEPGLAEALSRQLPWREAVKKTRFLNLDFIPRGHARSHIGELLIGQIADDFLKEIREAYDYVIFDTPPVLAADDTPTLAPKVEGTLMVMRSAHTSARMTQSSLDLLYQRQVRVLGLVFNCIDTQLPDYYYYQYYKSYYTQTIPKDYSDGGKIS